MMEKRSLPVLLALGVAFGSAFLFMKVIVDEIPATEIVAGRLMLGALTVFAIIAVTRRTFTIHRGVVAGAAVLAVLDSLIPYTLIAWAEVRIDSGVASVLISTMPIFTVAFAALVLPDERLSPQKVVGLGVGLLGVLVLSGGEVLQVSSAGTVGMLAVVAAAASYAVASVYAKMLLRSNDAVSLTGAKLALGALMALALTLTLEGRPAYGSLSMEGSLAFIALGVLSTGLAFVGYFWLVRTSGSVYASLVTYVVPVAGLALGWAVLGEQIGLETLAGAGLIALGVSGVMYHSAHESASVKPVRTPQLVMRPEEG